MIRQRLGTSKTLRHVDLSGLQHFTGRYSNTSIFTSLFRDCPQLESLYLVDCPRLEASALVEGMDPTIDLRNLKHLFLNGCLRIDGTTVGHILHHPTLELKTLHIRGCSSRIGAIRDDSWWLGSWESSPVLKHLTSLDISGLLRWKGNLTSLLSLYSLKEFHAQGCRNFKFDLPLSNELLNRILDTRVIERIDSETRGNITSQLIDVRNEVFATISWARRDMLAQWRVLNWNDPTCRISSSLCLVALQSRHLAQVYLRGCTAILNEEIQILAVTCGNTLKVCDLVGLNNLNDTALQAMGRFCHALVDLDVSACFELSDIGIISVATGCQMLRCLRMDHITKVTDAALQPISLHLKELLVLSIKGCSLLSQLARLPPHMVELDARETKIHVQNKMLPQNVVIRNGRRQASGPTRLSLDRRCSFTHQSKRLQATVKPQAMWSCLDCDLLPNQALCGECAIQCHRGHRVQMVAFHRFYCDCAVGLAQIACQCIKI